MDTLHTSDGRILHINTHPTDPSTIKSFAADSRT
jgi:hypothetical protein